MMFTNMNNRVLNPIEMLNDTRDEVSQLIEEQNRTMEDLRKNMELLKILMQGRRS